MLPYTLTPPYLILMNLVSFVANASSLMEARRDFVQIATSQSRSLRQRAVLFMLQTNTGIRSVSIAKVV